VTFFLAQIGRKGRRGLRRFIAQRVLHWKTSLAGVGALIGATGYLSVMPSELGQNLRAVGMALTGIGLIFAADSRTAEAVQAVEEARPSDPGRERTK
jgi:hypothetical protein